MAHTDPLTQSQVRHSDVVKLDPTLTFADLSFEGEARHVDEYRHAKDHEEESA